MIIAAFDHFIYNDVANAARLRYTILRLSTSDFRLDGITEFCGNLSPSTTRVVRTGCYAINIS